MQVKKRTMNELRQTKDSHYVKPFLPQLNSLSDLMDDYVSHQGSVRLTTSVLDDFIQFLSSNQYKLVKQHH